MPETASLPAKGKYPRYHRRVPHLPFQPLPWVQVAPGVPYFQLDDGSPWHPIGQNDAIAWEELAPLYRRRDPAKAEEYIAWLAAHGVTCMRLMLEYAQDRHRYFETRAGKWNPHIVRMWDDLFILCERHNIRLLLTPFDTFWMWIRFHHHPYNARHGGPLPHPSQALLSRETREAIKARLGFAAERWGGSGALFAWDLWNEIHPAQGGMSAEPFVGFITELSDHVREVEQRVHGRAHPQTVSLFGPELHLKAEMKMEHAIFRHPSLDFATIHIYEHGTIDDPRNTVDAARGMGKVVRGALDEITGTRPFLDTEHGPIHRYKDHRHTLPEPFDDEYFRHMQWAHLASGGAGGGMRWPNRSPHTLTEGMRDAQLALARFMPCVDWLRFDRRNITEGLRVNDEHGHSIRTGRLARFACASHDQALVYLLRRDTLNVEGMLDRGAAPMTASLSLPQFGPGPCQVTTWNTVEGEVISNTSHASAKYLPLPPLQGDMAIAIRLL